MSDKSNATLIDEAAVSSGLSNADKAIAKQLDAALVRDAGQLQTLIAINSLLGTKQSMTEADGVFHTADGAALPHKFTDDMVRFFLINTTDQNVTVVLDEGTANLTFLVPAGGSMGLDKTYIAGSGTYSVTFAVAPGTGALSVQAII